jgi:hypothetical protein
VSSPVGSDGTGYLGDRGASTVALSAGNRYVAGGWVATFLGKDLWPEPVEIYHIALRGPGGGFLVYIDDKFYSNHGRSDINEYDPNNAMYLRPGQTVTFEFKSAAAPAPTVNIFARRPSRIF